MMRMTRMMRMMRMIRVMSRGMIRRKMEMGMGMGILLIRERMVRQFLRFSFGQHCCYCEG
jgi:hypothetical protein